MEILRTAEITLDQNGWELAINKKPLPQEVNVGDLVKITIHAVSPMDFEDQEPIRSVIEDSLWVKIDEKEGQSCRGTIATTFTHPLQLKDGTELKRGDSISFQEQNIFAIRAKTA